jgi:hypothetical protein
MDFEHSEAWDIDATAAWNATTGAFAYISRDRMCNYGP